MRAVIVFISDSNQNARRFPRFHDRHHLVGFRIVEVGIQQPIAPALVTVAIGRFQNRRAPFFRSVFQPILELIGDVRQGLPGHPLPIAVGIEETEHALLLVGMVGSDH